MLASPAGTRVHTQSLEMGVQELCHLTNCGYADLLVQVIAAAWLVALVLLAVATLTYIREARDAVATERDRTHVEMEALDRFRRQVARLEASQATRNAPQPTGAGLALAQTAPDPPDGGLREVREAYERTVMGVPHFEEDYGEPFATHLSAEFGEEIARAVVAGEQFTPQLKQVLLERADEERAKRENLLRALTSEAENLDEFGDALSSVDDRRESAAAEPLYQRSFPDLFRAWHRIDDLEGECEDLLTERQQSIHQDRVTPTLDRSRKSFHAYLYGDLDVDYPVLADGASVLDRLRTARREVLRTLTRLV
jgi:hypothetical protein